MIRTAPALTRAQKVRRRKLNSCRKRLGSLGVLAVVGAWLGAASLASAGEFEFTLRHRTPTTPESSRDHVFSKSVTWRPEQTAVVVCDMWDQHWCQGATRRVAEMAPRMNELLNSMRAKGCLIIHCPSSCLDFYRGTPQRHLAASTSKGDVKRPLQPWCNLDLERESRLPIDDSDGGCDCQPTCAHGSPWTRQIDLLEIGPEDAITDSDEAYHLMRQRGVKHVLVMGVHTNMCVLGRPFSIRQLVYQGLDVVLVRDLTDTMYNSRMFPFVNHHTGTDLVVEHIERYWCPTTTSNEIIGGDEFRFRSDDRKELVAVIGEREYHTAEMLPDFCRRMLASDFRIRFVFASDEDPNDFPGLDVVTDADVVLLSVRRRLLTKPQLALIRAHVNAHKPIVAIRTSSHAFSPRSGVADDDRDIWPEFDRDVLGGNYQGHHNNKMPSDPPTFVRIDPTQVAHPILKAVRTDEFRVSSWLYKVSPLAATASPLMIGRVEGREPQEPVAWTHLTEGGGKVFYTSLGHPQDFRLPAFQRLLTNAIYWVAETEPTEAVR